MTHRTFRSLDEPPKLVGFTLRQWAAIIAGASAVLALVWVAHLPLKLAITLCAFTIGLPVALTYVSESGGLQVSVLLCDWLRWRSRPRWLAAAPRGSERRASRERCRVGKGSVDMEVRHFGRAR